METPPEPTALRRFALGGALPFLSGAASLVDQVAWQRLLSLHLGVGFRAVTLLVSAYLLGLGLGAWAGAGLARRAGLARFAAVQLLLGLAGLASLPALAALGRLAPGLPPGGALALAFAGLLVPTLLMGATLPLLAGPATRLAGSFEAAVTRLCFVNTLGAAVGALAGGYLLVSLLGLDGCVRVAAGTNLVLAAGAFLLREDREEPAPPPGEPGPRWLFLVAFGGGFLAIGYEIVWYRVVGVLVKDSPYAFASTLAVYLLGLAAGGLLAGRGLAGRDRRDLLLGLHALTALAAPGLLAALYHLARHPVLGAPVRLAFAAELHPGPGSGFWESLFLATDVLLWPLLLLFLPTVLLGAAFPVLASLAYPGRGAGRAVGLSSLAAVLGNAAGGLVTGLWLLQRFGTERTVLGFCALGLLAGLGIRRWGGRPIPLAGRAALVAAALGAAYLVLPGPGRLFAALHGEPPAAWVLGAEGADAVVRVVAQDGRLRAFINGQGHGYRPGPFFLAEASEALAHVRSPRRVLVIGLGAGTIAEAALALPEVGEVVVVELCPTVPDTLRQVPDLARLFGDPRLRLAAGDGRTYLLRPGPGFDAIMADPLRTTTASSNNLHSREFFALAAARLVPGGVLLAGGLDDSLVIPATLQAVFPHVRAYRGFSLASRAPLVRDPSRLARLCEPWPPDLVAAADVFREPVLTGPELREALGGVPLNTDLRPVTEYYLGLWLWQRTGIGPY